jgi:transcriptional regulator
MILKIAPSYSQGAQMDTRPQAKVFTGETIVEAFLDTRAQVSLIERKCAERLECAVKPSMKRI